MIAAIILVHREGEPGSVKKLLKRTFDYRRIPKMWYLVIFLLMPALYVITYIVMRMLGFPFPGTWSIPAFLPVIFVAFFLAAAGEELGYTGYVTDPMQEQYSALVTCLIMGILHAMWHYPSEIQIGHTVGLMVTGTVLTISFRILTVWLYNNTNSSVCAAILFHAVTNTGRSIFPGTRKAYELADGIIGYSIIAIAAATVVILWGHKTLKQFRLFVPHPE